jgi:flagellar biosynthesis protein FlhF
MQTKTYRAPNMLAALQEIQRELGPNAIVLSMREVNGGPSWQVWNKPGVEVVASTEMPIRKQEASEVLRRDQDQNTHGRKEIEAILTALAEKRKLIADPAEPVHSTPVEKANLSSSREPARWNPPTLQQKISQAEESRRPNPAIEVLDEVVDEILDENRPAAVRQVETEPSIPPMLKLVQHRLLRQGLDKNMVDHLVQTNLRTLSPAVLNDESRLTRYMQKQLEAILRPQKNSIAILQNRILCLVGATGSGKTSTCAKLAAYYHCTLEKKVVWICADTIRAGAISETRMYAEALEIAHYFAYTPTELAELVASQVEADLIIIDTPGVNPLDEDKVMELGTYLSQVPNAGLYVTAPATTKSADLQQVISTLALFKLKGVIATKMDETFSFGDLFDLQQVISTLALFKLKGVIATKMDETFSFGDLFNVLMSTHLPLHYFTSGTQIFGKLHQGEPGKLVAAIFGEGF